MVFTLSRDEVRKVCGGCDRFSSKEESCRMESSEELKPLSEVRKCPKWDKYFGGSCLFRG